MGWTGESKQAHKPALTGCVAVDVALCGLDRLVAGEQLNVAQAAAGAMYVLGGGRDEGPPSRMGRAAEAASFERLLSGAGAKASSLSNSSLHTTGTFPRPGARISPDGNCLASSICSTVSILKICSSRLSAAFWARLA